MNKNGNRQKRILCIVSVMNTGGAETFLMKIYRAMDRNKYQMDFFVSPHEEGYYEKEIMALGGRIFHSTLKSQGFFKWFKMLRNTVKRERYECVMRISQHSLSTIDLLAAKLGGAKTLVYRSSNSLTAGGRVNRILHQLFKWLPKTVPTVKIAPSTEAAEFVFGKNCVQKKKAVIVKNAIAVDEFIFDPLRRAKTRQEFGIDDQFVVGHIGRFSHQKNHRFLIDIFAEILKEKPDSVLLLVGAGELEQLLKDKIAALGLTGQVILTGVRSDIPDLLMAMDLLVFPSFFEGMPNTVIEAQAAGLRCLVSDTITQEAKITSLVDYLPLENDAKYWASKALSYSGGYTRVSMKEDLIREGYDINLVAEKFAKLIFNEECTHE